MLAAVRPRVRFPIRSRVTQPDPSGPDRPLTIGICTRDRPESLLRCLRSVRHAAEVTDAVIVADDASAQPVEQAVRQALGGDAPAGLKILRNPEPIGPTAGRNRIAREARTPFILYLDDDAVLLGAESVRAGLAVLQADPAVAVVAFPQADENGRLYPPGAQPSPATEPVRVQAFIGFAHMARRDAVVQAGGYRELLQFLGEERDLSVRLIDRGYHIVYLPDAPVAHLTDPAGRDARRFLHLTVRNDVLSALLNEPLPFALATVPVRLWRYFPMRRHWGGEDPGGFRRIVGSVAGALPRVRRERTPIRWSTLRTWRALAQSPPYRGPEGGP